MKSRFMALMILGVLVLLTTAGCCTARLWGAKAGSSPAHLGGDISVPLGK
jgi:hypothetical protein